MHDSPDPLSLPGCTGIGGAGYKTSYIYSFSKISTDLLCLPVAQMMPINQYFITNLRTRTNEIKSTKIINNNNIFIIICGVPFNPDLRTFRSTL